MEEANGIIDSFTLKSLHVESCSRRRARPPNAYDADISNFELLKSKLIRRRLLPRSISNLVLQLLDPHATKLIFSR